MSSREYLIDESNSPNIYLDIFLIVIKFLIIYFLVYYFGFIYGIINFIFISIIYHKLLEVYTGNKLISSTDYLFIGRKRNETMSLLSFIEIEDFSSDRLKSRLKEAIKKVPKLNARLKYFLGNYFWEYKSMTEERFNRIVNEKKDFINDYKDAYQYFNREINIPLNLNETTFECILLPYKKVPNQGVLIIKIDHSVGDGLSIVSLLTCLSDNFNINILPKQYLPRESSYFNQVLYIFVFLFYLPKFLYDLITLQSNKLILPNQNRSGITKLVDTQEIDMKILKKISKNKGITINELILSIVSMSFKRSTNANGYFNVFIPVGNGNIPLKLEDITIDNTSTGVLTKLPLINDLSDSKIISKTTRALITKRYITIIGNYFVNLLTQFLPLKYFLYIGKVLISQLDVTISNVPGPTETLYYNQCKIKKMIPGLSLGNNKMFIALFSYNNIMYVTICIDQEQIFDYIKFGREFRKIIEDENSKYN